VNGFLRSPATRNLSACLMTDRLTRQVPSHDAPGGFNVPHLVTFKTENSLFDSFCRADFIPVPEHRCGWLAHGYLTHDRRGLLHVSARLSGQITVWSAARRYNLEPDPSQYSQVMAFVCLYYSTNFLPCQG
jgi:hypothetical protein